MNLNINGNILGNVLSKLMPQLKVIEDMFNKLTGTGETMRYNRGVFEN